jgi:thiol-disulfide isomerase/thioredoxin
MNRRDFTATLTACAGTAACQGDSAHSLIGRQLPNIRGTFTDGRGFDLSQIGKPAVVRFWGMWCGPCMLDMPNWLSMVRQLRTGSQSIPEINILTIHVGLPPQNGPSLRQWVSDQQEDVATPVVDDPTKAIMSAVGITGTPSTLYIDPNGTIGEHAWQFRNERGVASFLRKVHRLHDQKPR